MAPWMAEASSTILRMGTGKNTPLAVINLFGRAQGVGLVHVTGQGVEIATRHHDGVGGSSGADDDGRKAFRLLQQFGSLLVILGHTAD